nr:hypothetical protein [Pandoravirus massiliensis]
MKIASWLRRRCRRDQMPNKAVESPAQTEHDSPAPTSDQEAAIGNLQQQRHSLPMPRQKSGEQGGSPHEVSALLVRPDGTVGATTINRYTGDGIARALGCRCIRRWPYAYTLDSVVAGDRVYRYDVWVDEEARAADREPQEDNLFASAAAHPLNETTGHVIAGNAILISIAVDGPERHLGVDDWSRIHDATWRDDEAAESNADGPTALCRVVRRARSL